MSNLSRLQLELLESRDLFAVNLRIADYNIGGDTRSGLATVLRAFSDEVVAGTSHQVDVIALEETDSQSTDTQAVVDLLNGIYGTGTYSRGSLNGSSTGAGTQGIVYRTSTIQLLSETALSASGTERAPLRYKLHAIGFNSTDDFYLYVAHPKASDTTADANERNVEAQTVRADMDGLPQGTNIIYASDTNFYRSSEPGWATFTAAGNGQLFDPINRVGSWTQNSSFADVHTQSPTTTQRYTGQVTGGMDDRFDFQLVSNELTDGSGLDILPTTYHVLGNNGTTYNQDIDSASNTWVWNAVGGSTVTRPALLTALASVTDHLPVIADYTISSGTTTTTALIASPNPSTVGQSVTFTATITPNPGSAGTVTFQDNGATMNGGANVAVSNGVATFPTASLSAGSHPITAVYSGGGTFNGSTSPAVTQVVNANTTTTVNSTPASPVTFGTSVSFTATVTGNPSVGTVTFYVDAVGSNQIGSPVNVSNGSATSSSTNSISVGTHTIFAVYSGGAGFNSSQGTMNFTVNSVSQTLQLSSTTYSTSEGVGTFSATVTRSGGSTGTVGVSFAVTPGSATSPGDYSVVTTSPLSFGPGVTSLPVSFSIVDDGSGEGNESFSLTLSNPTGGATLGTASATITITDPLLTVSGVQQTTGGAVVTFNRAFDATVLNLYDDAAGSLGAADVTLVGTNTGAVTGSLIVTAANQLTFLKTGGILAADSYTLTLRSAASGIRDLAAVLLDGDANGTAGGNYSTTITVSSSSARVVSVPDVVRGAGQPVNVPASGTGLPLRISDGSNVTAIVLDLAYDPSLLAISAVAVGPIVPPGSSASLTTLGSGLIRVSFSCPTALGAGAFDFARLTATVPNTAPYTSKAILDVRNVSVNNGAISAVDDDGVDVAAYLGDANGSWSLSGGDASLISQVAVGIATGFTAYQNADPILIGDANGSGALSGGDASLVSQKAVGLTVGQIPDIPSGVNPSAGGPDPRLYLVGAALRPGETATAQVRIAVMDPAGVSMAAGDYAIRFDSSRFAVSNVRSGSVTAGFGLAFNVDNAAGTIRVTQYRSTGVPLTSGFDGDVLLFDLTALQTARPGRSTLNLLQKLSGGGNTTWTGLYDAAGPLTLGPAPTDHASDRGIDAIVTVVAWKQTHDAGATGRFTGPLSVSVQSPTDVWTERLARFDLTRTLVVTGALMSVPTAKVPAPASSLQPSVYLNREVDPIVDCEPGPKVN